MAMELRRNPKKEPGRSCLEKVHHKNLQREAVELHMNLNERAKRWWGMEEPVSPRGKMFHHRKMLAHHRHWRGLAHHTSWNQTMVHCMSCWMKLDPSDVS